MRSIFQNQKSLENVLSRITSLKPKELEEERDKTKRINKINELHGLSIEILESCRNSLGQGVLMMAELEKQLRRMDNMNNIIDDIRKDLNKAQYYFSDKYTNLCKLLCCLPRAPVSRSNIVDRLKSNQVEEAERELVLSMAVYRKFAITPDDTSDTVTKILTGIKTEYPELGAQIEANIRYARKAIKLLKSLALSIAIELKLQNNQLPAMRISIDDVTDQIHFHNEMNKEVHNV